MHSDFLPRGVYEECSIGAINIGKAHWARI
jgi:hypothetical protein